MKFKSLAIKLPLNVLYSTYFKNHPKDSFKTIVKAQTDENVAKDNI